MSNWCCSHSVHNLEMPSDWILFDGLMKIVRKGPRKTGVECVMFLVCFPSDKALESGTTSVREARTRSESPGPRQLQQKLPLAPLVPTAQMSGSDGNEGNGSPRSPTSVWIFGASWKTASAKNSPKSPCLWVWVPTVDVFYFGMFLCVCHCVRVCVCWLKLFSPGSSSVITGIWREKTHLQTL